MFQGIEFNEWRPSSHRENKRSKLIELVIKYSGGLIKDERQANYIIIGIIILIVVLSVFFIAGGGSEGGKELNVLPA